jgi:Domain of unknown function (DUF1844)
VQWESKRDAHCFFPRKVNGMSSEEPAKSFKVVDRRRFDELGDERVSEHESPSLTSPSSASSPGRDQLSSLLGSPSGLVHEALQPPNDSDESHQSAAKASTEVPPFDLSVFVMSLADQAMWQLGAAAPPPGVEIPLDRESGKQTIDILTMIEIKTRGNRDAMEERVMKGVLHELRMVYLKGKQ